MTEITDSIENGLLAEEFGRRTFVRRRLLSGWLGHVVVSFAGRSYLTKS